jgi:hypothetical protein
MKKTGLATLPLHGGKAPVWLFKRMVKLGKPIFKILYEMEGSEGILKRISDTFWFQSLSCVLGFDWHSSGTTTVTTGVLKEVLNPVDFGIIVVGGKGKKATNIQNELSENAPKLGYNNEEIQKLKEISRIVAKIDNTALQDDFNIYHHVAFLDERNWTIVQQGLDISIKKARRYHWFSKEAGDYLNDPHKDISTDVFKPEVLNMVASESENCRKVSLEILEEGVDRIKRYLQKIQNPQQKSLLDFAQDNYNKKTQILNPKSIPHLKFPRFLNWDAFEIANEESFSNYIDLLKIKGIGPGAIRALALISELIWGIPASWKDPAKFSFAHGGKDGIPYMVNLKRMETCAEILEQAIDQARLNNNEKFNALKRLHKYKENIESFSF